MDLIQKNILSKALAGKLGHFFIVTPPGRAKNPSTDLTKWTKAVIEGYFQKKGCSTQELKNNEDVLVIDEEMVNKKYYDKSFVQIIGQFLSHKPARADRKFILIEDMEKMSAVHSNKLLKVFEEPPVNATIFLLNPSLSKALSTISSRAVTIRANVPLSGQTLDLEKWSKKVGSKDLHQFCDYFKARSEDEKELAKALLDLAGAQTDKALFEQLEKYLKHQVEDSTYNHNSYARLGLLREIYLKLAAPGQS